MTAFLNWFSAHHGKDESPEGDLIRLLQNAEVVVGGDDLPTLRRFVSVLDPSPETLTVLDRAWQSWESRTCAPTEHPFVTFLVERHGDADTPLGHFSRSLSPDFPVSGERIDLRRFLEYNGADEYVVACFEVGWSQFRPTCTHLRCPEPAASKSLLCELHGLL